MKIGYNYKMQWYFGTHKEAIKSCKQVIKAIGAKSLTVINFRNDKGQTITNYNGFISYPFGTSEVETIKHINKMLRLYTTITEIELIRR